MDRQQAKALLPIIQAFAEGKTIQYCCGNRNLTPQWIDIQLEDKVDFNDNPQRYRIKPEPKYRPFKDAEECWQEMLKHQPFGWIRNKITKNRYEIECLKGKGNLISSYNDICCSDLEEFFQKYDFADGTPFGIKEE